MSLEEKKSSHFSKKKQKKREKLYLMAKFYCIYSVCRNTWCPEAAIEEVGETHVKAPAN